MPQASALVGRPARSPLPRQRARRVLRQPGQFGFRDRRWAVAGSSRYVERLATEPCSAVHPASSARRHEVSPGLRRSLRSWGRSRPSRPAQRGRAHTDPRCCPPSVLTFWTRGQRTEAIDPERVLSVREFPPPPCSAQAPLGAQRRWDERVRRTTAAPTGATASTRAAKAARGWGAPVTELYEGWVRHRRFGDSARSATALHDAERRRARPARWLSTLRYGNDGCSREVTGDAACTGSTACRTRGCTCRRSSAWTRTIRSTRTRPAALTVHIENTRDGERVFDATLSASDRRRPAAPGADAAGAGADLLLRCAGRVPPDPRRALPPGVALGRPNLGAPNVPATEVRIPMIRPALAAAVCASRSPRRLRRRRRQERSSTTRGGAGHGPRGDQGLPARPHRAPGRRHRRRAPERRGLLRARQVERLRLRRPARRSTAPRCARLVIEGQAASPRRTRPTSRWRAWWPACRAWPTTT